MRSRFTDESGGGFDPPSDGNDVFLVTCPYCGEALEIYLEPDVRGALVQDCEVCCRPWAIRVSGRGADRVIEVERADD